jgi:hypothetical protein
MVSPGIPSSKKKKPPKKTTKPLHNAKGNRNRRKQSEVKRGKEQNARNKHTMSYMSQVYQPTAGKSFVILFYVDLDTGPFFSILDNFSGNLLFFRLWLGFVGRVKSSQTLKSEQRSVISLIP